MIFYSPCIFPLSVLLRYKEYIEIEYTLISRVSISLQAYCVSVGDYCVSQWPNTERKGP